MAQRKRRGFTIIELVIVIAVIAILAGVLIPTFVSVIKKANLSNDKSMVKNINTALAAEVIPQSKFDNAGDAINALYKAGWNMGKLETYSQGFHYAYSLENNRMYLVDDTNAVIYPEESAVQASSLWYLWKNTAVDKVQGATKYVSLVNITDGGYFGTHFAEGTYQIDLADHYINYTGTALTGVTVFNGVFIASATKSDTEDIIQLGVITKSDITNGTKDNVTVIENKVYDCREKTAMSGVSNVKFVNCFFYNCNDEGTRLSNRTFENCTFIDATSYIFNLQGNDVYDGYLTVKDCKFINCARVFNMVIGVRGQTVDGTITVDGNTFYGVTENKRSTCQFNIQIVDSSYENADIHYLDITFSNNKYVECASTQAGLFTIYDNLQKDGVKADHITFVNNTFASDIDNSKIFVNDDGKANSDVTGGYNSAFKDALYAKIK